MYVCVPTWLAFFNITMYCLSKIIFSAYCSVLKLTPKYVTDTTSIFHQFQPNPFILFYLKSRNHNFFLLTPTEHLPIYKDTKNFNDFF